ncbi:MAG: Hsp70 family protein [Clostridiales bacterium]|nr:Hsp70 family protein [Clostridiales bacterium]
MAADIFKTSKDKQPVDFCLDLGGDSIKIAFAFRRADGSTDYGKVDTEGDFADVGIPAVVFYDEDEKKWLYGEQVDEAQKSSFITVVRIKDLLSLLQDGCAPTNKAYYEMGEYFPKFFFPVRRDAQSDFDKLVKSDRAFKAEGFTPRQICENYFLHIRDVIARRFHEVCDYIKIAHKSAYPRVSVVYSPSASDAYISELDRIIKVAFGAQSFKQLSSTKALSMYAYTYKYLSKNDEILVFDLGEETLSVAKAIIIDGAVAIDGEDGHNTPQKLGGIDVDEALVEHIESTIRERETPGTPSYGESGHLIESGLQSKQYLLMKDLKQAKVILSRPITEDSVFKNGVPISVWRELCIKRVITRDQLSACLGIDDCTGVAKNIVDYVLTELARPINGNVHKICLSGGIAKTYMLASLIDKKIRERGFKVNFVSFGGKLVDDNEFDIFTYEDTAYAPAVGGAIVALNDYDVKTTLSLSYGTYVYKSADSYSGRRRKLLELFVERGKVLEEHNKFLTPTRIKFNAGGAPLDDYFCSTILTSADVKSGKYKNLQFNQGLLIMDEIDSSNFKAAEKEVSLRVVVKGKIILTYRGERVNIPHTFYFQEGVTVDGRGRAKPLLENISTDYVSGQMEFYRNKDDKYPYKTEYVSMKATDIKLEFHGDDFILQKG